MCHLLTCVPAVRLLLTHLRLQLRHAVQRRELPLVGHQGGHRDEEAALLGGCQLAQLLDGGCAAVR